MCAAQTRSSLRLEAATLTQQQEKNTPVLVLVFLPAGPALQLKATEPSSTERRYHKVAPDPRETLQVIQRGQALGGISLDRQQGP